MAKEIALLEENVAIHQTLGDNPNTDNGLSAADLKAKFDEAPEILKRYINDVLVNGFNGLVGDVNKMATSKIEIERVQDIPGIADSGLKLTVTTFNPETGEESHSISYIRDGINLTSVTAEKLPYYAEPTAELKYPTPYSVVLKLGIPVGAPGGSTAAIQVLSVNGTTYDGSMPVDLTDTINAMIDAKLAEIASAEEVAF